MWNEALLHYIQDHERILTDLLLVPLTKFCQIFDQIVKMKIDFISFGKWGTLEMKKGRTSFTSILKWKSSGKGPVWNISTQRTAVSPRNNTAIHLWLGRSVVSRFWVVWPSFCSLVASPLTPPWQQTCPRCLWHSDNLK